MKSFFTKLGTLLLCGVAVAVVGCTDFSEDIQAGDKALQDKIESVEKSTASTIAELKASISALEAAQKKMEADYAKKSELDAAKADLQAALEAEVADLNTAISAINTTLDGKADKSAVEALQKTMEAAVAKANETIANLDKAQKALEAELAKKADKSDLDAVAGEVDILKNGYQETVLALTELQNALNGKANQSDLELTQNALKTVTADVESLKQAYMEIVAGFQQFQSDLAAKANQSDLELAEKDIEALKTASAEAVLAIANLNTAVAVLEARVDGIENELAKAKEQIAQHTNDLLELSFALEQAKGDLEDEAEAREKADKALQDAYSTLNQELTNFEMAYQVEKAELEAQIDALKDEAKKNTEGITNMNGKFEAAIAELQAQIDNLNKKYDDEVAKIYNVISQERTAIEGMVAHLEESISKAFAEADKAILAEVETVRDSLVAKVYSTISDYNTTYEARFETNEALAEEMYDEFTSLIANLAEADVNLNKICMDLEAELTAQKDELESLISNVLEMVMNNGRMIDELTAELENQKGLISALTDRVAANEKAIEALEEAKALLEARVEALEAQDGALSQSIIDNYNTLIGAIEDASKAAADSLEAKIAETTQLIHLQRQEIEGMIAYAEETAKADLEAAIKDFEAAESKLNDAIKALGGQIQTEFNEKIQSVVYVPELGMTIPGEYFTFNGKIIKDSKVTLNAKFQVEPAGLISRIEKGELSVDLRTVKTKAYTNASTVELIFNNTDKAQGIFEVKATFPAEKFHKDAAVALFVYDATDAAPKGDEVSIDFSNAVTSEYVKTSPDPCELNKKYRLVKKDGNAYVSYKAVKDDEVQWSASAEESLKAPFAGFEVMIEKEPSKYFTLDEVAALAGVEVAAITPKYVGTITYKDALDKPETTCKVQTVLNADKTITDFQFDIIRPEGGITVKNAKDFVKHNVTAAGVYKIGTTDVITGVDYKYTIVNRRIFVEFEDRVVDWTYALAEKLSSTKTKANAYNKNVGWASDAANCNYESFREIPVTVLATGDYTIKDIAETMKAATDAQVKFFLNDKEIVKNGGEPYFNFSFTAYSTGHQLAFANIADYAFTPGKDNVYNMRREYEITEDYTDIIVKFKATFTGMPANQTYDLGSVELPMNSNGYIVKPIEATKYFFTNTPAGEFADAATFNAAFYAEENLTTFAGNTAYAGYPAVRLDNSVTPVKGYSTGTHTYIKLAAGNEYLRLSTNGDLLKATDSFLFDNNYEAWYGVNYRVKASAKVVLPNYSIAPVNYWVKDGVVTVPGHTNDQGEWVIDDMRFNTYVQVLGVDKASTDLLAVRYETVTKADATKGINNVPDAYSTKWFDPANNTINEHQVAWGDFTGREFDVKATLVMKKYTGADWSVDNTLELGSVNLTMRTEQMLEVSAADVALERNGQPEVSANFWEGLTVYGKDVNGQDYVTVDGEKVQQNLVKIVKNGADFRIWAATKYGLDLKFDKSTLKVYVDGVLTPDFPTTNYEFNETSGELTFKSNEATLLKPIRFEVEATITYDRDYEGKDAFKQTLAIVVSK